AVAANPVDRTVARRRRQPRARVRRGTVAGPALGSDRERFLGGFLGEVEVAEVADQGREHAPPFVVEGLFDQRAIAPPVGGPRSRRPCAPPGSGPRSRQRRRGPRRRRRSSRRAPPWPPGTGRRW